MTEQRQDDRLTLEDTTVAVVDHESGVEFSGHGHDVSRAGLSFHASMEPPVGAELQVTLRGEQNLVGALQVTRVAAKAGGFDVAGRLSKVR
jgi:hypothetical protein